MGFLLIFPNTHILEMQQSLRTSLPSSTVLYLKNKLKNYDDYLQIQKVYGDVDTHPYDLF